MKALLTWLLICCAGAATAQSFPAIYSTAAETAADPIEIHAAPRANAPVIGQYPPYAVGIEVLNLTGNEQWARIGWGEVNGFVPLAALARDPDRPDWEFPATLVCTGTEPSWRVGLYPGGYEFDSSGTGRRDLNAPAVYASADGFFAHLSEGPTLDRFLTIRKARCTDGMSDRKFGWEALLYTNAPDGSTVYGGCCTLDAHGP